MNKKKNVKQKENKSLSFTKKLVLFLLINAELQIWASYILAFFDKVSIADAISVQTTITVLGAFVTYGVKSLFENLSKYGKAFTPVTVESNGDIITDETLSQNIEDTNCNNEYELEHIINEIHNNSEGEDYSD